MYDNLKKELERITKIAKEWQRDFNKIFRENRELEKELAEERKFIKRETDNFWRGLKDYKAKVLKAIDKWWNNQPKNRTEKTIEELKAKLRKMVKCGK